MAYRSGLLDCGRMVDGTLEKIKSSGTFNIGYIASCAVFIPRTDRRPVGYSIDRARTWRVVSSASWDQSQAQLGG
jgi:hypothetical protein